MHTVVAVFALPVFVALAVLQRSSKAESKTRDFVAIVIIASLVAFGTW
jgi:hypothetical protein